MKYNIYINQKKAIEWELSFAESILVDLFTHMPSWAESENWWWFFSKNKILEEAPILSKKGNIDTIYKQAKQLIWKDLLEHKKVGIKDYWKLTDKIKEWHFYSEKNPEQLRKKSDSNSEKNLTYNNTSINNNTIDNKKLDKKEGKGKEIFISLLAYYIESVEKYGTYNKRYHKNSLSLERIERAMKETKRGEEGIKEIIDRYIKENRENIRNWYGKVAQYFFWQAEKGSKTMFYEDYLEEKKEEKKANTKPTFSYKNLF